MTSERTCEDSSLKRSLHASDYLSVRHVLPKTNLHHVILHENVSQNRHLFMNLNRLARRQGQYISNFELSRRTFLNQQTKKHRKWKSEDEARANNMNFPSLRSEGRRGTAEPVVKESLSRTTASRGSKVLRSADAEVLYRSPRYLTSKDESPVEGNLLPFMSIRRESTEFIKQDNTVFVTKLPAVIEIDDLKLRRYNTYCGTELMSNQNVFKDIRFEGFVQLLKAGNTVRPYSSDQDDKSDVKSNPGTPSPSQVKQGQGLTQSKVMLPSLPREGDFLADADHSTNLNTGSKTSKRNKISRGMKNKDVQELLQSYEEMKNGWSGTGQQYNNYTPRRKDIANGVESQESDYPSVSRKDRQFRSSTLKKIFRVKSEKKNA